MKLSTFSCDLWLLLFTLGWVFGSAAGGVRAAAAADLVFGREPVRDYSDSVPLLKRTFEKPEAALVAGLDGTIYLVEVDSLKPIWAFSSGREIYSSYQARNLSGLGSNYYIDCGEDWKLYAHDSHGKVKLIPSLEEFISSTPQIVEDGVVVLGSKKTTAFLIDARTGRIIHRYSMLDSKIYNSSIRKANLESNRLPLYVTRTDYRLTSFMPNSDKVLWNLSVSEIGSAYLCELPIEGDSEPTELDLPYKMSFSCQSKTKVFRYRNHTVPEFLSLLNGLPNAHYEDKRLPDSTSGVLSVLSFDQNHRIRRVKRRSFDRFRGKFRTYQVILFVVVLFALAVCCYRIRAKWNTKNTSTSEIDVNSRQKRNRRSVKAVKEENENGIESKFWQALNEPISSNTNGETIGKLVVLNKHIGKGSNGTIVLEGFHEGRSVAVKRLVRDFHDIAVKEIRHLIVSDRHPNIVRWYGVEQDQYFIYLALERCVCCLNDLVLMLVNPSGNNPIVDMNSKVEDEEEYGVCFDSFEDLKKECKLWTPYGNPSSLMRKLMRDIVCGIVHLHELGIIHRDLKPQNVLIVRDTFLCAKISDMGISKRLVGDMSSLSNHATGSGSSGWQSPEQLLNGRQTRAVDMFSLGCVLFFFITGGRHLFGNSLERDINIVHGKIDLFPVEHLPEAVDLFLQLLDLDSEKRPSASEVLHHPLLWNPELRLSFLRDSSDRIELEDREMNSDLLNALECIGPIALGSKWNEKMEPAFLNDIGRYRRYRYDSVRDLLRVFRNKLSHFRELPAKIQALLGPVPEGFDRYFTSRFPKLLIEVYKVMLRFCRNEDWFYKYLKYT